MKLNLIELKENSIKSYAYSTVIAKLKDGSWDTSYDVKQGKHLEVTDNATKKRLTIFVEETISEEKLSATQISALRQEYSKISKVDPSGEGYKKLTALLDKLDKQSLQDLVDAKIKFVSSLALNRISQKEAVITNFVDFEKQHKKMYPNHNDAQIKAAWEKYQSHFSKKEEDEIELEESADKKQLDEIMAAAALRAQKNADDKRKEREERERTERKAKEDKERQEREKIDAEKSKDRDKIDNGSMTQDEYDKKWELGNYRPGAPKPKTPEERERGLAARAKAFKTTPEQLRKIYADLDKVKNGLMTKEKFGKKWKPNYNRMRIMLGEDENELEESTVSASQIDRYIDTENWKAIADLLKGLTDDEHELWAKNGYGGRTYELMMKSRERSKSYKDAVEKMKNTLGVNESAEIDSIIKQFIDSGRVAVHYPKKKTISVSGVNMPEKDAVEKMKRILSIKESVTERERFDEELELFESENEEQLNEELFATLAGYYLVLKLLPIAAAAALMAAGGTVAAISYAIKGGIELKNAVERAKRDANLSQEIKDLHAQLEKSAERLRAQTKKNPKKVSLIKKAADALYNRVKKKTEAEIAAKKAKEKEKIAAKNESTQLDEMQELYAVVDTTDGTVVATSSSEDGAKRSIRSAHLPPISSPHPSKLKIVKTKKTAQVGWPIKEETNLKETPSLETLRIMKIVSLATGCTDSDALYEYALTSPSYSSIVELKENFNKYIQDA